MLAFGTPVSSAFDRSSHHATINGYKKKLFRKRFIQKQRRIMRIDHSPAILLHSEMISVVLCLHKFDVSVREEILLPKMSLCDTTIIYDQLTVLQPDNKFRVHIIGHF